MRLGVGAHRDAPLQKPNRRYRARRRGIYAARGGMPFRPTFRTRVGRRMTLAGWG